MKLKSLILIAVTTAPTWAVQAAGPDLLSAAAPESGSSALLLVGLGLMAAIARRRFR